MGQEAVSATGVSEKDGRSSRHAILIAVAAFMTALNAAKPLTIDDSVYYLFADHIAQHPLDPYGFHAWGAQEANSILAPPVFLYAWALALRLFGQSPVAWKLVLLPFSLLLVYALDALARRLARGMEAVFVCFVCLSGAVLPCLNLMLDVPALALALLALVLFLRACETGSVAGAVAAGLVAGVAMQTKYTAFVAPAAMILYGWTAGRLRHGLLAALGAGLVFAGWEGFIVWKYGRSHFWWAFTLAPGAPASKLRLVQPLFGYLGSSVAGGLPFALVCLGRSARLVWAATSAALLVFALVAVPRGTGWDVPGDWLRTHIGKEAAGVLFGLIGLGSVAALAVGVRRLLRGPVTPAGLGPGRRFASVDGFLVGWLLLELAGYFALSPYPATRRLMGMVVVGVLVLCRLAARPAESRQRLLWAVVGVNLLFGLMLFAVDFHWYAGQKAMARRLARECRTVDPGSKVWYFGNGAFEFYADRLGLSRLILPGAAVAPRDWVLVVDGFQPAFSQHPVSGRCELEHVREWGGRLPVRSQLQYGSVALKRQTEPLVRVLVYRVKG